MTNQINMESKEWRYVEAGSVEEALAFLNMPAGSICEPHMTGRYGSTVYRVKAAELKQAA